MPFSVMMIVLFAAVLHASWNFFVNVLATLCPLLGVGLLRFNR